MYKHDKFANLYIIDHPLIQHKLSIMRNKNTSKNSFRQLLAEISLLMGYEVTYNFKLTQKKIETPLTEMKAPVLSGKKAVIIPILRAGLTMSAGLETLMPSARIGHIGLYRDPQTHIPIEYLVKLPKLEDRVCLLVDPMIGTGNSLIHATQILLDKGATSKTIRIVSLVASPEGISAIRKKYPDVAIYLASLDEKLDKHAYILPGLGDAGDRMFGTY